MFTTLVTGVAGFIGSHLAVRLLDLGHRVVGLDNFSGSHPDNLMHLKSHPHYKNFEFIEGDIRDIATCHRAVSRVDYVLHQAALGSVPRSVKEPVLYHENNITGTLNMLMAARDAGVKRFVLASSSSVYGDTPTLPKHELMPPAPLSPYAVSKLTGEAYCHAFYRAYGLPTVALRYFNVFGPRQNPHSQYAAVIPKFVTACRTNAPIHIYGDGEQTRDFTFVDNVVQANILACACPEDLLGQAINVGCGDRITVNQLARQIQQFILGDNVGKGITYLPPREGDIKDSLAAIERLTRLGVTDPVTLEAGLAETVAWYLAQ
jgi:nucleoside-diphosphate-sugar epimerase